MPFTIFDNEVSIVFNAKKRQRKNVKKRTNYNIKVNELEKYKIQYSRVLLFIYELK